MEDPRYGTVFSETLDSLDLFNQRTISVSLGSSVRTDMHAYLGTVLRNHDCTTLIVGGTEDHVHALFALSRNYSIANIVKEIKRTSSASIKR